MTRTLPITIALLLVALPATSQELSTSRFETARIVPEEVSDLPAPVAERAAPEASQGNDGRGLLSFTSLAHAVGGAIVGGFVGYVGAQVVKSDWDKENNGSFKDQRSAWVAGGAVVGLLGSRLIGRTGPVLDVPQPGPPRRDALTITEREIREADVTNAYDLVHSLHREWLIPRGPQTLSETRGAPTKIVVYLDDVRIGGTAELRQIPVDGLTTAEFLGPARATYRYGSGHGHGAILLSTKVSR
jgi:hypothetical protein